MKATKKSPRCRVCKKRAGLVIVDGVLMCITCLNILNTPLKPSIRRK